MNSPVRSRSLPMLLAALAASTAMLVSALAMASPARADDAWTQQGIDIDGEAAGDGSGYSVATSADGSTVAIGAPNNSAYAGQVRVYSWNGSTWIQRGGDIDGGAAGDYSGFSVAMSADGTTVAIGAPYNDSNGSNAGQVRVYSWNGSTWTQQGIDIDGEAAGDYSGFFVAMSADGSTVAIGAPFNGGSAGQVRVYSWSASTWIQRGGDIDGEAPGDYSGYSVALSEYGTTVAIGAPANDGTATSAGQVRVYAWNGSTWIQRGGDIDGEAIYDQSGYSVAMSADGTTVAIGAPANSGGGYSAGQVRVYTWNSTAWTQRGGDIDGEAAIDQSGYSVAMSAGGSTVAIGAPANGSNAGQVRVYTASGSTWTQRGGDIDGEAVGDSSGWSVATSSDGSTVAIGAPYNRGSAGQVRVFTWLVAPAPMPPPTFPPGAPTGVMAVAGDASVSVSWVAPLDSGSYPISNYQVTSAPGDRSCLVTVPALTCTVSGLTNGTSYTFTVRALNGAGWGSDSAPSNAVTPRATPKPSIVITGSRDAADTRVVRVSGTTTGLVGEQVTPWVRLADQSSYTAGTGVRTVAADGTFAWSRATGKKVHVYFTHGSIKSNTVVIASR